MSQTPQKPPGGSTDSAPSLHVGRPMDRVDGRLKVTGGARYAAEFDVPGMAHAVLVQSGIARGRVTDLDASEAEHAPGVLAVITFENMPQMPLPSVPPAGTAVPLLSADIVYSGQNIAVVVAETLEQAQHGAALVDVEYAVEEPDTDMDRLLDRGFVPNTAVRPGRAQRGDFNSAVNAAAAKVQQTYRTPIEHHNPMEPHATLALWSGDKLTVYDATQGVSNTAQNLAELFQIAPEDVHVIDPFVGGGFGCKGQSWPHTPIAALAARVVKRPVKLVLSRRQMFTSVGHRPYTRQENAFAARQDGHLVAIRHRVHSHTSQTDEFMEPTGAPINMLYSCPNVDIEHRLVRLHVGAPTYARAPGEASGSFGQETAMDELAVVLNMDPVELRKRNYAEIDEGTGHEWSSKSLNECYDMAAQLFGWSRRDPRPGSMRDGRWLVGWGMATASYPANFRPAGAKARMYRDGNVWIGCGTQDLGTGTYTILTQIAADVLGVQPSKIRVQIGDSRLPSAPTSGGSCSATSAGSAVQLAAQALRGRVIAYATSDERSPLFNLKSSDLSVQDGRVFAKREPAKAMTYEEILTHYGKRMVEQEAFAKPGIERGPQAGGSPQGTEPADKAKSNAWSMQGFGAQFCEVRVDPDLGIIRVAHWVGSFALGKVLNAKTMRSQLQGGIVWGIGMALQEDTLLDQRFGCYVNTNLAEYHVPVNADVPDIDIILVEEQDALVSPVGAKGAGEIGITGAAAAICNAVYHATGRRVRELEITLEKMI
jgi:xanthine dehydrogenase YagR molybdenum-binding subunit